MTDKLQESIEQVREFVRQRKMSSDRNNDYLHGIHADPKAEMANLTISALISLVDAATEVAELRERVKELEQSDEAVNKILDMTDEQITALTVSRGDCPNCAGSKTAVTISNALIEHYKKEKTTLHAVAEQMAGALDDAIKATLINQRDDILMNYGRAALQSFKAFKEGEK